MTKSTTKINMDISPLSPGVSITGKHDLALEAAKYDAALVETFLSPDEIKAISGHNEKDRLAGRIACKKAMAALGLSSVISNDEDGRPELIDLEDKYCSISHSGEHAVAVVSDFPVGVDLETQRAVSNYAIDFVASRSEKEQFAKELLKLWISKEAVMKALGKGFKIDPHQIVIDRIDQNTCEATVLASEYKNNSSWIVQMGNWVSFEVAIAYESSRKPTINWHNSFNTSASA